MSEKLRYQKASFTLFALVMMGEALAQTAPGTPAGNVATDPVGIFKKFGCWIVNLLSSPALIAVAGAVLLLIFGWGKVFGEMNAFQSFKNGLIGVIIILGSAAISTTLFGAGCAA